MPKDDKSVQNETVSPDSGTESTETGTEQTDTGTQEQTQEQPLTKEDVQRMIAEQTETAKREIQSAKDKATAEVAAARGGQRFAEDTLAGYQTGLGTLDPEQAELIRLRAESTAHKRGDAAEAQRQQLATFDKSFTANMSQFITSAGLDSNDKRIDWAEDVSGDYLAKQQRILASVTKAQKEDAKTADDKRSQEFKDMEDRLRKDLGIDSVDTSLAPGEGTTVSRKALADMSLADYRKNKEKIDAAYKAGRIK